MQCFDYKIQNELCWLNAILNIFLYIPKGKEVIKY